MSIKGVKFPDKNGKMFGIGDEVVYKGSRYTVARHTTCRINLSDGKHTHATTPNMVEVLDD